MAKQLEAKKWANSFLPKETKASDVQDPSSYYYYYIRLPIDVEHSEHHQQPPPPPYVVVPLRSGGGGKPDRLRKCISCKCYCLNLILLLAILFLAAMGLIVWLSQPKLNVVRVHLNHMNISGSTGDDDDDVDHHAGSVFLDASMDLEVMLQNRDMNLIPYSYNLASIFIGYQGVWHQPTVTNQRFVNAGAVSYLEATVGLDGTQQALGIGSTAGSLGATLLLPSPQEQHGDHRHSNNDQLGAGLVPLDILVEVGASCHFLYVYVPVQGRISCSVNVDMENQTIANQNCYPLHDILMDLPNMV